MKCCIHSPTLSTLHEKQIRNACMDMLYTKHIDPVLINMHSYHCTELARYVYT